MGSVALDANQDQKGKIVGKNDEIFRIKV